MVGHLALIGLMGAGKTTVGRELARRLGRRLVDTDRAVEARTGRSVRQLWEDGGEAAYRDLERRAVLDALAADVPAVLAVPGGVAVDPVMAAAVTGPGVVVVYLRARPATLAARVGPDPAHRPLLGDDPAAALAALHAARDARYREIAAAVVDVDDLSPAEIATAVETVIGHRA